MRCASLSQSITMSINLYYPDSCIVAMDVFLMVMIGLGLFLVFAIFLRRYISALIEDYVLDLGFSLIDELFGGIVGLDIGDFAAAIIIFIKERKIVGLGIALAVAWEATNFFPISLIPVIGTIVEFITNLLPCVTIMRMLFNRFGAAEKEEHKLEKELSAAEKLGIDVESQKKILALVQSLIRREDPVDALALAGPADKALAGKLIERVNGLINETNGIIKSIEAQEEAAPVFLQSMLREGIMNCEQLIIMARDASAREDFDAAIDAAMRAKQAISSALDELSGIVDGRK